MSCCLKLLASITPKWERLFPKSTLKIWKSGLLRSRQDCVGEVVVKEAHFVIDQPPNKLLERTRDQIVCGPLSSSVSARGIATNRGFNVKKGAEGAVSGLTLQHCA